VLHTDIASQIRFDSAGLVPVIVQDRLSGAVLMLAWADQAALAHTLETRRGTYFSRSRNAQWVKGDTSGAVQHVHEVKLDCDGDAVLYIVDQSGAACHNGTVSCFDTTTLLAVEHA
jgi:phosphoribosyl-AMP cyclohydrolase